MNHPGKWEPSGKAGSQRSSSAALADRDGYHNDTALLHEGATKGILVTTAEFGPSAQEFATGKPLTLIGGKQLVDLLAQYGIGQYTVQ